MPHTLMSKNFHSNILSAGILLYLILISIGYLTTTESSQFLIRPIRYMIAGGVVVCLVIAIVKFPPRQQHISAVMIYLSLLLYGIFLSELNESFEIIDDFFAIDIIVTLVGIVLLSIPLKNIIDTGIGGFYILYMLAGLLATVIVGGISFSYPPEFLFVAKMATNSEIQVLYSQEMSRYFGVGSILSAFFIKTNQGLRRIIYLVMFLAFSGLSLLAGGRGDSIIAIAVSSIYLLWFLSRKLLVSALLFASLLVLYFIKIDLNIVDDFLFIQRFLVVGDGDFGMRDNLAFDVFNLLANMPICLIRGCGFGYFQKYYNYEYGFYPHNVVLEFVIVFGVPIFLLAVLGVLRGVVVYYGRVKSIDIFLLLFIYSLLISLKSGYIFGDWFLTSALMVFLAISTERRSSKIMLALN